MTRSAWKPTSEFSVFDKPNFSFWQTEFCWQVSGIWYMYWMDSIIYYNLLLYINELIQLLAYLRMLGTFRKFACWRKKKFGNFERILRICKNFLVSDNEDFHSWSKGLDAPLCKGCCWQKGHFPRINDAICFQTHKWVFSFWHI